MAVRKERNNLQFNGCRENFVDIVHRAWNEWEENERLQKANLKINMAEGEGKRSKQAENVK